METKNHRLKYFSCFNTLKTDLQIADDKFKDLDVEIPRHFVKDDGTMASLSIPETEAYDDFFERSRGNQPPKRKDRLFTMNDDQAQSTSIQVKGKEVKSGGKRVLNGYTVPKGSLRNASCVVFTFVYAPDHAIEEIDEVKEWLFDVPSLNDDAYDPLYTVSRNPIPDAMNRRS